MRSLGVVTMVIMYGLFAGCSEQGNPFPFEPNRPNDFNRTPEYSLREGETEELLGDVAMFTHEVYQEYHSGLVSEHAVCFDSAGHCLELYYRDRETNQRYTFQYDSLGRRVEEVCYIDSAGTPYDSIATVYMRTIYHYSHKGRTCRARITAPDGRHYTYRFRYDRQGRLHRFIYPDGSRFTYDYDTAGRLVRTTFPDASSQTFQYNEQGNITSMRDCEGIYHWYSQESLDVRRDTLGRVVEEVSHAGGGPFVTTYSRDVHGNWTRRTLTGISSPTRIDNRTFKYFTR